MADFKGARNPAFRHGKAASRIHKIWIDMRQRCQNPNRNNYKHYGGRGITICDRWQVFENFYADMGDRPTDGHSLERKDVNGPYSPENCVWATLIEQRNNMRSNRWITIDGRSQTIGTWAIERSIDERLIRIRIRRGWSEREAVLVPAMRNQGHRNKQASMEAREKVAL